MEPHEAWFPIEVTYPTFQHAAWRCSTTGEVLMVEDYINDTGRHENGVLAVIVLPQDFKQNPHPIKVLDIEPETVEGAIALAHKYMEENPDG